MRGAATRNPDARLEELLIDLPTPSRTTGPVEAVRQVGDLCWVTGALPWNEGKIMFRGRVGLEVTIDNGQRASRAALLQVFALLKESLGELKRVKQCVKLSGFIAAGPDFQDHSRVLETTSQLLFDVFGVAGRHAREAIGVSSLPHQACVMLELLVRV
ncbi:MAG: RidA family protein [Deltaproteobacteria bacterium]|nr:RidA family protein [Deltaproteobacteria bacterium]